ncbi:MAG: divalent metal cation transporter [Cyclobacteriaceae bacterium]
MKKPHQTLASVILWSVISAAFIGPGTVTTAASAGVAHGLDLLWAVVFATIACILLQEASARLTISTGLTFGQSLDRAFGVGAGRWLRILVGGSVVLGCAAYEAGNILGGGAGAGLLVPVSNSVLTVLLTIVAAIILFTGRRHTIGWVMTLLVALMGVAFIYLAARQPAGIGTLLKASFVPTIPIGSEMLILGLIGTTIVPYNIFLGSGISKGQTVSLMRTGLTISVMIGGIITAAILVAGTSVSSFQSFQDLSEALRSAMGDIGAYALGIGLFAAGFSSAITSPYAASIIAAQVFDWDTRHQRWVWASVLAVGFAFGISGVRPIPVIIAVQVLNGLILPFLTAFLAILLNNPRLMPADQLPGKIYNTAMLGIFGAVLLMSLHNIDRVLTGVRDATHLPWIGGFCLVLTAVLTGWIARIRGIKSDATTL